MNRLTRWSVLLVIVVVAPATAISAPPNWPQFRGADSRGIAESAELPKHWSASENVAWKTDIPGRGWSSPIVWEGRVFLTTVVNLGTSEPPKKGLYFGGDRPEPPQSVHQWWVYCLDLETGKILWQHQVHKGKPETSIHLKNSFASETPVTDGERVVFHFGHVGLFCFDMDGNSLWTRPIEPRKTRHGWGAAASPMIHEQRLYLLDDNDEESYLQALDLETGEEVWRVLRDEKSNWSTPYIWQHENRTEIVTPGTDKVRSYDLNGELLWWFEGMSSITIATPYEHAGLLYISSGYVGDSSRPIYAVRPGGEGDITLAEDKQSNEWIAWCRRQAAPYNPSTLIYRDRLYVLYDFGFFACYDPRDGSDIYGRQRIPRGRAFTSSPWAYDDTIFCLNEDGVTFVLKSDDEFELLHTNSLAEDDMCMATPAMAGNRLLIRTSSRVYCIQDGAAVSTE